MAIKKSQTKSKTSAKTAKSSVKKNITDTTKTVKKPDIKKPLKAVKAPATKLSRPKTASKPAGAKSGPEIKKPIKRNIAAKKPDKTPATMAKGKIARPKKSLQTIGPGKSATPEKKPLKKSPAKIVPSKTKVAQEKTIKPLITKKPAATKVSKVVAGKTKEKTVNTAKAPAKTVKTAGPKVSQEKTIKPVITKKPAATKVSKVVAGKSTISSTIPQIKETIKNKPISKPKEKTKAPLSTSIKTIKNKVTPPSITPGPPTSIIGKTAATITTPAAETKPKKISKLKVFLPEEELPPEEAQRKLPEEYGENELLLMEVDPSIVFVSWEIKPDDISGETGKLALRVYDVTGIVFDGTNANRFFDIALRSRSDSKFFDIKMQGKDIIIEIGLLHPDGTFKAIKQSNRVSMPELQIFDEFGITGPLSDTETLIGY